METPEFKYPHYIYRAKVVNIVDGDTIDVDLDLGFNITVRKRLRFIGIDTWEVRGEEKEKGIIAKERLTELLSYGDVYIQTKIDATGKYGRVLAWVWVDIPNEGKLNINNILLEEGHGTAY